jgi:hypothetical protein
MIFDSETEFVKQIVGTEVSTPEKEGYSCENPQERLIQPNAKVVSWQITSSNKSSKLILENIDQQHVRCLIMKWLIVNGALSGYNITFFQGKDKRTNKLLNILVTVFFNGSRPNIEAFPPLVYYEEKSNREYVFKLFTQSKGNTATVGIKRYSSLIRELNELSVSVKKIISVIDRMTPEQKLLLKEESCRLTHIFFDVLDHVKYLQEAPLSSLNYITMVNSTCRMYYQYTLMCIIQGHDSLVNEFSVELK